MVGVAEAGNTRGFPRVLVVDDEPAVALAMERTLRRNDFAVTTFNSPLASLEYLEHHLDDIDVILLDVDMPEMPGLEVLARIKQLECCAPVVMWTADERALTATKAMQAGAFTYVTKPIEHLDSFIATLHGAVSFCALKRHARSLERRISGTTRPVGESSVMRALRDRIDRLARSDVTVLIQGESGTGKELVAHAIHERSARANKPFVAVNCGAISETLIDSELFGHSRGAFTGAIAARAGVFVEADGGTLFLDEISEMPLAAQARLLRVLQEREVRVVGGDGVRKVDVRVVAATNAELAQRVTAKLFREDLYYRLNVAAIALPPLRDRATDIPVLAAHLLAKHRPGASMTASALAALCAYAWPGNVRELENALLHALAMSGDLIDALALPASVTKIRTRAFAPSAASSLEDLDWSNELSLGDAKRLAVKDFERRYVGHVLARTQGNLTQAARLAGLDRANLRRILHRLGVDADQFRAAVPVALPHILPTDTLGRLTDR